MTISSTSVLVSADPVIQLVPPLPEARTDHPTAIAAASYDALYGNGDAPAWNKAAVTIAVGTVPGSYLVTLGPDAVADADGISEVRLTSGGRGVDAEWTAAGASFLWAGRPGQPLHLVATDAHPRFRRSGWLELPPLPDGGWAPQLELAPGVTPLATAGGADWMALADAGIWLYGLGPLPVAAVPPGAPDEEVEALAADDRFVFAVTRERLDVLDRNDQSLAEVPVTGGAILDVVAADWIATPGATLLLLDDGDPAQPVLRLAELSLPAGEAPQLAAPSDPGLPALRQPALLRSDDGTLHLFGLDENGDGVVYSWPSAAPGEALAAPPVEWQLGAGWHAVGGWERGAVLLDGATVSLLEYGAGGWSEVALIDLGAEAISAAVAGDRLVVLLPGEIQVYDVSTPAAPVLESRHPGSAYRQVEPLPNGEVLLWSPRMAVPPLRWNPATAVPGEGFQPVIEGLP